MESTLESLTEAYINTNKELNNLSRAKWNFDNYEGIVVCENCKSPINNKNEVSELINVERLAKPLNHIMTILALIKYDSNKLKINKSNDIFLHSIEDFQDIANQLEREINQDTKIGIKELDFKNKLKEQLKKVEVLRNDLLSSPMYKAYKDCISQRPLDWAIFNLAETTISTDTNLAPL